MNPIHRRRSLASTLLLALPLCAASLGAQGYTIQTDTVLITWSDGIRTQMDIHYPTAAAPSRGWPGVLCSHGSGGNRGRIEAMAKHLARQGYMAFAYDIRPFGVTSTILNPPTFDASQERRVLDGAESFFLMENLYGTKFDYENLAAVGRSMGGGISLKLAAHSGRTLPLPLPNPLPYNPFVTKGPVLKAVATMIAPVRAVDARITANGDLFRSDTADAIQSTAPSQWWTWALAGNYQNIRAAQLADPLYNFIPGLKITKVPVHCQMGWDDSKFAPSRTMDALITLGGPYKGLVTGPGHGAPTNVIDKSLNRDNVGRWFDKYVKGVSNSIDLEPKFESAVTPMNTVTYNSASSAWGHRFSPAWPRATPVQRLYLRGNATLSPMAPAAAEPSTSVPHAVPGGYTLASYVANGAGAAPIQIFANLPITIRQFVGQAAQQEYEILGRPKITAAVTINQTHFQLSATLWARNSQGQERYLSGGTVGRRVTTVGTHRVTIEMRDVSYIVPVGVKLVVKLHNMSWERPAGQSFILWVPDLQGSVSMSVQSAPATPAILHLPKCARRGVNLIPRLAVVSAGAGFNHSMKIDGGPSAAAANYVVYLGMSGIAPGINIGKQIWLNVDPLTTLAIGAINTPVLTNFAGVLNANGLANPSFNLPAGVAGIAGLKLSLVTLVVNAGVLMPSEPIQLHIHQ